MCSQTAVRLLTAQSRGGSHCTSVRPPTERVHTEGPPAVCRPSSFVSCYLGLKLSTVVFGEAPLKAQETTIKQRFLSRVL